ncbi:glycoside hydrolase family 31 protein [Paenibacillus psychroresistens]|uniref:Glycoside hydrolase family 31 protein n=1 Tax=Paenibacillus psychroresistens TaxID=1778678 RepID=A0A6B8RHS1_9BACL|nr:TIM-barrel domain-containing protein [Paenibacillus psychroresistens]QGQ95284.1 glycoside hydrolase family 31 protein [Paenibacillus psychroresistens]
MNSNKNQWIYVAPGIWKLILGNPNEVTPLSLLQNKPSLEGLNRMGDEEFPAAAYQLDSIINQKQTLLTLPLTESENIYGLGLQFMRMNHRGYTRVLRVNSDPRQDTGETHAPVPFYISSEGYGLLINTCRIVTMYCGSTVRKDSTLEPKIRDRSTDSDWQATPTSDQLEIVIPHEQGIEIYLFAGPNMLNVVRRYNLFCGGGALPPRWGLGFWHRVSIFFDEAKAIEEAIEFRKRELPCDVFGLEPGWHSNSYPTSYEWSDQRFPDPQKFVSAMKDLGFRLNLWENPYVAPIARIYESLKPFAGSHTVWGGLAPDYSLEEAQRILIKQHEADHLDIGISGYKIDECDGSELTGASWMFPAHATFPSGLDGEQMRQVYGLLLQKMTTEMFHVRNQRTYGLVRASSTGAASFPYVLYSDLYDHRQFVRALCNASFSGLLWTPELRETDTDEDFVRRLQTVCFSPLAMLNAWASGVKPWNYGETEPIVRKYLELRMQLMPYLYSAFARYHFDGTPPFRAMELEMGTELNCRQAHEMNLDQQNSTLTEFDSHEAAYGKRITSDMDDQYMMGDSLLIAPLFAGESSRKVVLPIGDWFDFESGECFEGGRSIKVQAGLDKIPVFVRNGGIVPLMPVRLNAPAAGEEVSIEIRHYGKAAGEFLLFDDDGETYNYEQGEYQWRILSVSEESQGRTTHVSLAEDNKPSSYKDFTWNFY